MQQWLRLGVSLLLALVAVVSGAVGVVHGQSPLELVPLEDERFAIRSVVPAGWTTLEPGVHARMDDDADRTLIVLRSVPQGAEELWQLLSPQFGLADPPAPVGTRATAGLEWTLYRFDGGEAIGDLAFDVGLAETDGETYIVLVQSPAAERAAIHEALFIPAVEAFEPIDPAELEAGGAVRFPGGSAEVTLAGTISLPDGDGPHPAVLLLSGIGPHDRDASYGSVASIKPFVLIAEALTEAGLAVLRYDDRGVGASSGDHATATVGDFMADARAALAYLGSRDDLDASRLGLLGHGEGAIYAAAIAADDPDVAFVVGMAPPAVTGVELLVDQNVNAARALDDSPEGIERVRDLSRRLYAAVMDLDLPLAEALTAQFYGSLWDEVDPARRAALGDRDAFVAAQVASQIPIFFSPWYRSFLASDPAADWAAVEAPVIGIFGGKDTQVPGARNELALRAAVAAGERADLTTVILPGANHLFQAAETGLVAEYRELGDAFDPDFLPTLVDWISATVGRVRATEP
jgi:pimeloyl-ACP methyl ester carboxylesterase